jgi:hypothetical protein
MRDSRPGGGSGVECVSHGRGREFHEWVHARLSLWNMVRWGIWRCVGVDGKTPRIAIHILKNGYCVRVLPTGPIECSECLCEMEEGQSGLQLGCVWSRLPAQPRSVSHVHVSSLASKGVSPRIHLVWAQKQQTRLDPPRMLLGRLRTLEGNKTWPLPLAGGDE